MTVPVDSIFGVALVAGDSAHGAGYAGELRVDELNQVAVEGRRIPISRAEPFDDLTVGQGSVRVPKQCEHSDPRGGRPQARLADVFPQSFAVRAV